MDRAGLGFLPPAPLAAHHKLRPPQGFPAAVLCSASGPACQGGAFSLPGSYSAFSSSRTVEVSPPSSRTDSSTWRCSPPRGSWWHTCLGRPSAPSLRFGLYQHSCFSPLAQPNAALCLQLARAPPSPSRSRLALHVRARSWARECFLPLLEGQEALATALPP